MQGQPIPPDINMAHIKVLPKPGKDNMLASSYRPISLIDNNLKYLSKILADRLSTFLPKLITPHQVGFIQVRAAVYNIRKVLEVLDEIKLRSLLHSFPALLAIDAEKAFDNVSWGWLDEVLDTMGFQGQFRTYITSSRPTIRWDGMGFNPKNGGQ